MTLATTTIAATVQPHTPRCPRCGYDLAGVPPTWTTQCPLEGTCSECGHHVEWARVMNPSLVMPPWLYEGGRCSGWNAFSRLITTSGRSLLPFHFWSHVRLDHPVRPWDLFLFAMMWVVVSPFLLVYAHWLPLFLVTVLGRPLPGSLGRKFPVTPATGLATVLFIAAPALWLALLPHSRRMARVRLAHVARVTVYGIPGVIMLVLAIPLPGRAALFGLMPDIIPPGYLLNDPEVATYFAIAAWTLIWWLAACGLYMRLPKWGAVAACLTVMTMLAYLAVAVTLTEYM